MGRDEGEMFCERLSKDGTCQILKEECFRKRMQTRCDFFDHFQLLMNRSSDPPLASQIKSELIGPILESWKDYARNPSPGKKGMTGYPLEIAIRSAVKERLDFLGVEVPEQGKKYPFWKDLNIIADCLTEKEGYPNCIISMKSWIAEGQIRETFAYAYFTKMWHGQKNIRVYMLGFTPVESHLQGLIEICKPYIDGVYSLSGEPYIDDLLEELRRIYV